VREFARFVGLLEGLVFGRLHGSPPIGGSLPSRRVSTN
jgi:hypothetical protein